MESYGFTYDLYGFTYGLTRDLYYIWMVIALYGFTYALHMDLCMDLYGFTYCIHIYTYIYIYMWAALSVLCETVGVVQRFSQP